MQPLRYFFKDPPDLEPDLSIHGIGIQEPMPPGLIDRPGGTGDYLFIFFYDEALIRTGREPRRFPAGTMVLWTPSDGHYYGNTDQPWSHSWLHCAGRKVARLLRASRLPLRHALPVGDASMVEKYLYDLHLELNGCHRPDPVIAGNILENWFLEIARAVAGHDRLPPMPPAFQELKNFMLLRFHEPLRLEHLAKRVNLSVPHFCACFRKHFSVPPIEYITQLRLHHAARLLRDRNLSVKEVAVRAGYNDIFYFSKLFKKRYGASPKQHRGKQAGAR